MSNFKRVLKPLFYGTINLLVNLLGSDIRDVDTGERIGRALLIPWRGRVLMFGADLAGYALLPKFRPQQRLTDWKVELGFTRHSAPDYPHEPGS